MALVLPRLPSSIESAIIPPGAAIARTTSMSTARYCENCDCSMAVKLEIIHGIGKSQIRLRAAESLPEQPEDQGQHDADQQAGHEGKVKTEIVARVMNIAG